MAICIAGGLLTGAGSIKTEAQWQLFGGIINAPLDPCYHQVYKYQNCCQCAIACVNIVNYICKRYQ